MDVDREQSLDHRFHQVTGLIFVHGGGGCRSREETPDAGSMAPLLISLNSSEVSAKNCGALRVARQLIALKATLDEAAWGNDQANSSGTLTDPSAKN